MRCVFIETLRRAPRSSVARKRTLWLVIAVLCWVSRLAGCIYLIFCFIRCFIGWSVIRVAWVPIVLGIFLVFLFSFGVLVLVLLTLEVSRLLSLLVGALGGRRLFCLSIGLRLRPLVRALGAARVSLLGLGGLQLLRIGGLTGRRLRLRVSTTFFLLTDRR